MESCLLSVIEIHFVYGLELITLCIIKLIIRKAYGFRNILNMPDMVYLVCSDLRVPFPLPNRRFENRLIRTIAGVVGDFHLLSPLKSLYTHSLMTPLPYLPAAKSVFFEIRIQAGDL